MSEFRRRLMMAAAQGGVTPPTPLPYDSKVEYLQSNGTQYINTDIVPDDQTGMQAYIERTTTSDLYCCGVREGTPRYCIGTRQTIAYVGWNSVVDLTTITTRVHVELNFENSRKAGVVELEYYRNLGSLGWTPTQVIRLFGTSGTNASYTKWTGRMYGFKVSQGSDVILDLIPVRVGSVGYMYDKLSGTLYGNDGTGNFTLGNDIN